MKNVVYLENHVGHPFLVGTSLSGHRCILGLVCTPEEPEDNY